jgi:hypothetical protein
MLPWRTWHTFNRQEAQPLSGVPDNNNNNNNDDFTVKRVAPDIYVFQEKKKNTRAGMSPFGSLEEPPWIDCGHGHWHVGPSCVSQKEATH